MLDKLPYKRYVIASLLRGQSENAISRCLRSFGLCDNFVLDNSVLGNAEFQSDVKIYAKADLEGKSELAVKYDIRQYITHAENKWPSWADMWDIASVNKYREFVFVLGSLPTMDYGTIADAFNKKFSKDVSKIAIELVISSFWDLKKMPTADIKAAIRNLTSNALAKSISKILYGDSISAAKSVGASLKLNYALILEEMLFEAYHKYKQCIDNKAQAADLKDAVNNILKIGDRFDKIAKKDTGSDVLRELLQKLKLDSDDTSSNIDEFMRNNKLI